MSLLKGSDTLREMYPKVNSKFADLDAKDQELKDELDAYKLEHEQQRQSDQLKVAKVEKELNDYKATMQQINIHQSPTQKATGHGIISLPPNAAEGQVSVTVGGQTWTNLIDGAEVAPDDSRTFDSVDGHIYFDLYNGVIIAGDGTEKTVINAGDESANMAVFDLTQIYGQGNEPTAEQAQARLYYINDTKSTIGAVRIKSVSADETETSTAYVVAKDEQGKIAELRSLPNGVNDEVRASEGKLIKRVSDWITLDGSESGWGWSGAGETYERAILKISDAFPSGGVYSPDIYCYLVAGTGWSDTKTGLALDSTQQIRIYRPLNDPSATLQDFRNWLGQNPIRLIYQLAQPIEIPVQVSGTLIGYPSGTVYIEPIVADAGIYTDKMEVLHKDLPIKSIEKIGKVDYTTGLEYELDPTQAVISSDGLSFTHPALANGDIVFFIYEYSKESTIPEMTVEYYDSRFVVKDSVTGKFYHWNLVVANGQWDIQLTEV